MPSSQSDGFLNKVGFLALALCLQCIILSCSEQSKLGLGNIRNPGFSSRTPPTDILVKFHKGTNPKRNSHRLSPLGVPWTSPVGNELVVILPSVRNGDLCQNFAESLKSFLKKMTFLLKFLNLLNFH